MANRRISLAQVVGAVRKKTMPICVGMLLVTNSFLIWRTREMHQELTEIYASVTPSSFDSLLMEPLQGSQSGTIMLHHACRRYLALFIFVRYDGPFYTDEVRGLNRVALNRPDIGVYGLMAYATPDEAREFVRREGISYPMLVDTDGRLLRGLGLPRTPWNVTFDCARRQLVYQGPSTANGAEGQSFPTKLLSFPD